MMNLKSVYAGKVVSLAVICVLMSICVHAQNTVYFNIEAEGLDNKTVPEWGLDTSWASSANMRESIVSFGGPQNVDTVRISFHAPFPLQEDGTLDPTARSRINTAAGIAKMPGNKPMVLTPASDDGATPHEWYRAAGGGVIPERFAAMLIATAHYLKNQHDITIWAVEVWNEPDYWPGQATPAQFHQIVTLLRNDPIFQDVDIIGPSTLSPNTWWYDQVRTSLTMGSTHKLGGSATGYISFIQHVHNYGHEFHHPEIHSMAEMLMGAEYGMSGGTFWANSRNPRGKLVQALKGGRRLGYAEHRGRETAAAVYRAPSGHVRAFAGGFERQGTDTYYRLVSTDHDVFFDGVGPIREYMIKAARGVQGTYVDILHGSDAVGLGLPLDSNRWKIVNRQTGHVLQVINASTSNGGSVNVAADTGALHQRWNITRNSEVYYALYNANSGRLLSVVNSSTADGAAVEQRNTSPNLVRQWTMDAAGDGYFYLLNGNSGKYLTGSTTQAYQTSFTGSHLQQWQFVAANPSVSGTLTARYELEGNAFDSTGSHHATAYGSPAYTAGQLGRAIDMDGVDDYVQIPGSVVNTHDITVAAWVNWNGGSSWQRLFDFGSSTDSYMFLTPRSGDNTMRFAISTDGTGGEEILDTDPLPIGQWVHIAVTLTGNTGILYINGAPRVAGEIRTNPSALNATTNYIGRSRWSDPYFRGLIDDFRIYDYALTAEELDAIMYDIPEPGPWEGEPYTIPGVIEAEHFDIGEQGVVYYDTTQGNSGGAYRLIDDVDIVAITDGQAGYAITDIETGEWLLYTVHSNEALTDVYARVASVQAGGQIRVWLDEDLLATIDVPNTGSLTTWQTVMAPCLPLPERENAALKIEFVGTGFRLNWIRFSSQSPYPGAPSPIPGRIEFEDFDVGGQLISYYDKTPTNGYGQYRPDEAVDIQMVFDGALGFAVYAEATEWIEYTCDIEAGYYTITVRSASPRTGGQELAMSVDGQTPATFMLPNTGGWGTWQSTAVSGVYLPGGERVIRFAMQSSDCNLNYVDFVRENNPADITQSGRVDLDDFSILAAQWLGVPGVPSGDIAPAGGDGQVDIFDLLMMAENWLKID